MLLSMNNSADLTIHPLVQEIIRLNFSSSKIIERLIILCDKIFLQDLDYHKINPCKENILLHFELIMMYANVLNFSSNHNISLLKNVGAYYLFVKRDYISDIKYLLQANISNGVLIEDDILIDINSFLGFAHFLRRDLGEANKYCKNAYEKCTVSKSTTKKLKLAFIKRLFGYMSREMKNHPEAYQYFSESLSLQKEGCGQKNEQATTMYALAYETAQLGKIQEAINLCNEALKIKKQIYKTEKHPEIAAIIFVKGIIFTIERNFYKAKNLLEKALLIYKEYYGDIKHLDIAKTNFNLSIVLFNLNMLSEAENKCKDALIIYKSLLMVGGIFYHLGQYSEKLKILIKKDSNNNNETNLIDIQENFPNKLKKKYSIKINIPYLLMNYVEYIIGKYHLTNFTQKNIKNALIQAISRDNLIDVFCLLPLIDDINELDNNDLMTDSLDYNNLIISENMKGEVKRTLLHWLMFFQAKDCIPLLIVLEANICSKDSNGETILDYNEKHKIVDDFSFLTNKYNNIAAIDVNQIINKIDTKYWPHIATYKNLTIAYLKNNFAERKDEILLKNTKKIINFVYPSIGFEEF